jgi:hypothetical protein
MNFDTLSETKKQALTLPLAHAPSSVPLVLLAAPLQLEPDSLCLTLILFLTPCDSRLAIFVICYALCAMPYASLEILLDFLLFSEY